MRLLLRPKWRLWPLSSFVGLTDLKTGVTMALLFALLNKVAGIYGLIAVLTGAGGSFAQLSLYIYSVIALLALTWGLRAVKDVRLILCFFFSLTHPPHRRIQDRPSTLPTFLPQTMSSQLPGPSFSLLSGGSGRLMMVDVRQTHQHRGHDENSQCHPPSHSSTTSGRRYGHLEPRKRDCCHRRPHFLALQGNANSCIPLPMSLNSLSSSILPSSFILTRPTFARGHIVLSPSPVLQTTAHHTNQHLIWPTMNLARMSILFRCAIPTTPHRPQVAITGASHPPPRILPSRSTSPTLPFRLLPTLSVHPAAIREGPRISVAVSQRGTEDWIFKRRLSLMKMN